MMKAILLLSALLAVTVALPRDEHAAIYERNLSHLRESI